MKTALITGITGQDGSYLSQFLLEKGYKVVGMVSDTNDIGDQNILDIKDRLILETGDLLDKKSLEIIIKKYLPDEIYNLAGISFIPTSWDKPALTYDVNALGPMRILEIIRDSSPNTHFFQATSAKIFGSSENQVQDEKTPYNPEDPYGVSKLAAHLAVKLFRSHFNLFLCSGILFNHESEKRGPEFVTRKITQGVAKIKLNLEQKLPLGNLDSQVDWGYAPDYVEAIWLMLQQDKPNDYILATGQLHSVREVCEIAFSYLGLEYQNFVTMDEKFYRPQPAKAYSGNPKKARSLLGWQPKTNFKQMIEKMVDYDLSLLNNNK
jgi:GDPmannose 4,6-dehydratase